MAKELPYFKFFVSEWTHGDVTLEDYNVQGVFINICAYYWSNNCVVPVPKLKKKFKACEFHIDILINSNIIKVKDDLIEINFLDKQLSERDKLSKQNRINALKRWKERSQCDGNASASDSHCESDAIEIRQEKKREDKIRKEEIKGSEEPTTPFKFKDSLISYGFKKELVTDWLKVRKTKRATNTKTAFDGFIKIIENSPRDKNDILQTCVENSWSSYKDEWYNNLEKNGTSQKSTSTGTRNTNSEVQEYDEYYDPPKS